MTPDSHEWHIDDGEVVTADWLLSIDGFYRQEDHCEFILTTNGFWKIIVDLEEPPDLSITHKGNWLAVVKANATRGDVRRLCKALGIELKDGTQ